MLAALGPSTFSLCSDMECCIGARSLDVRVSARRSHTQAQGPAPSHLCMSARLNAPVRLAHQVLWIAQPDCSREYVT